MKELNTEPLTFSIYDFYKMYSEQSTIIQDYINVLENQVIEEQPTPSLTVNEFKFLR